MNDCPKCHHSMADHHLSDTWGVEVYQCWAMDHPYTGGRCGCKHMEAKMQDDGTPLCATCGTIVDSDGFCIVEGGETHETGWDKCPSCYGTEESGECYRCTGHGLVTHHSSGG